MFSPLRPVILMLLAPLANLMPAATVAVSPYAGANYTVSMPQAWAVVEDVTNGMVIARQDAKRDDSAAVLFLVRTADANLSEDQLLDSVVSQFAKNLKISLREAIPGGGHRMVADGMAGSSRVRTGVIALVTNGAALVSLLICKPGEFEPLGGIELVSAILTSLKAKEVPASATQAPQTLPAPSARPSGKLDVPPLKRPLTVSDLAGEWGNDDSIISHYVNYRGDNAGFESIATREKWIFDANGGASSAFTGTIAGRGGARQINEKKLGKVVLSQGPAMTLAWSTGAQPSYVIRGWLELPDITVLLLNGPWYGSIPADVIGDRAKGTNLNSYWVRKSIR